jgi:N,N-dimethylformamidase beta subunit-like, C-terminal
VSGALSRRRFLAAAGSGVAAVSLAAWERRAAVARAENAPVPCPGANPIVDENWCTPASTWSDAFQLGPGGKGTSDPHADGHLLVYPAASSVGRGGAAQLAVASYDSAITRATLDVYRLGYYGGAGGRRVYEAAHIPVSAQPIEGPDRFGLVRAARWPRVTVPGAALAVSGVYLANVVAEDGPDPKREMQTAFVVRDDGRPRDLLVVMPTNTWQAYNRWGGKCLYSFDSDPTPTVVGSRGVKVSYDRPYANVESHYGWVLRCEFPLIWWLEREGYDLAYTDDRGLHFQPDQLLPGVSRAVAIAGHSEYWTAEMLDNLRAARDAGTSIASFSANTAYWRARYEDGGETVVCFKTVEDGSAGVNDFGPGQDRRGTTVDPLGPDGLALTADDLPRNATTTLRDRGAFAGSPDAPDDPALNGRGRVRADDGDGPENRLFGVLFVGGADQRFFPLQVPPEIAGHRLWRHTPIDGVGGTIGTDLVGWEWDAIPQASSALYADAAAAQPDGVERVTDTPMPPVADGNLYFLADDGRSVATLPPSGQGPSVHSTIYRAASGALVFAAGTMQWSWGLGPHYNHQHDSNYLQPPTDSSDGRIAQATYNLLADMGVQPATPTGVVLDEPSESSPAAGPGAGPPPGAALPAAPGAAPLGQRAPVVRLPRTAVVSRAGVLHLLLDVEGDTGAGTAALTLESVHAIVPAHGRRPRRRLRAARRRVFVPGAEHALLRVRLAAPVLRVLRRHRELEVHASVRLAGAPGPAAAHGHMRVLTRA